MQNSFSHINPHSSCFPVWKPHAPVFCKSDPCMSIISESGSGFMMIGWMVGWLAGRHHGQTDSDPGFSSIRVSANDAIAPE